MCNRKISHEIAIDLAGKKFDKYQISHDRKLESDFDREIKNLLNSKNNK